MSPHNEVRRYIYSITAMVNNLNKLWDSYPVHEKDGLEKSEMILKDILISIRGIHNTFKQGIDQIILGLDRNQS